GLAAEGEAPRENAVLERGRQLAGAHNTGKILLGCSFFGVPASSPPDGARQWTSPLRGSISLLPSCHCHEGKPSMPTSSAGRVSRELRGHIILIGLDRTTKRNAFDQAMLDDLVLALGEYERDDNARCALVFAHGEHFTAGLDLAGIGDTFKQGW